MQGKLYHGEEIFWISQQSTANMIADLCWKGLFMWFMFGFVLPEATVLLLTFLIMVLICYLDFRKQFHGRVCFITDQRAIYAEKTRKGSWRFTDFPLSQLASFTRKPVTRSLLMKFRLSGGGTKLLRFPYLLNSDSAVELLKPYAIAK